MAAPLLSWHWLLMSAIQPFPLTSGTGPHQYGQTHESQTSAQPEQVVGEDSGEGEGLHRDDLHGEDLLGNVIVGDGASDRLSFSQRHRMRNALLT